MRAAVIVCFALTAIFSTSAARADRGALSIEAGGALAAVRVAAPYSTGSVVGSVSALNLGARYAVANSLELSARVFYEPSTPFYVHGVTTTLGTSGSLSAGLITHVRTQGALLGARVLHGNVWRFIASAEAGIAQVSFTGQDLVDESNPKGIRSLALHPSDASRSSFALAPGVGVEWVGDRLGISFVPRLELLLGTRSSWAIVAPLTVSWDFYL